MVQDARTTLPAVLGIGELLWDLFPDGPRLGGAPFNVTANLRRLGHPAAFVTSVGADELGHAALAAADELGVETTFVATTFDLPTGTVAVTPDPATGHRFDIVSPAAYESIGDGAALVGRIAAWRPGAIVFGTLAQRFRGVRDLTGGLIAATTTAHRLYDVNLRDGCWTPDLVVDLLGLATIVKVNEAEALVVAGLVGEDAGDADALGPRLSHDFGTEALCVTRGADGAALWMDGRVVEVPGLPIRVADTVGAGDAFAAGLLHAVLQGRGAEEALRFANRLGALVASRPGALPDWTPAEVESA